MLPPKPFGTYMAVGTQKRSSGSALFFEVDPTYRCEAVDIDTTLNRCVPHPDGTPKHSVYASTYRAMEHVPLDALKNFYLTTRDGRVLELEPSPVPEITDEKFHLFLELCPVTPLIATTLKPEEFCEFITDPNNPVSVPRICFVDLTLEEWAFDPKVGKGDNLPYSHRDHLRECLFELETRGKKTKTVDRVHSQDFPYRCIKNGFYVGDQTGIKYYSFPSPEELEQTDHAWWRSANVI